MDELEKIWCGPKEDGWPTEYGYWYPEGTGGGTPYIREDIHEERLKEAYERGVREATEAADEIGNHCLSCGHLCGNPDKDISILKKAGARSCCPERKIEPLSCAILAILDKKEETDG